MAISGDDDRLPSVNAASSFMLQYGQFEAAHRQQLESLGLPKHLWQTLYKKLAAETFDLSDYVVFGEADSPTEEDASGFRSLTDRRLLMTQERLDALSNVFLVDHGWTTTVGQAAVQLENVPGLLERMEALTGIYEPEAKAPLMPDTGSLDAAVEINVPVVVSQTGVSEDRARQLLKATGGDIIEAIVRAQEKPGDGPSAAEQSIQARVMSQLGGSEEAAKPLEWRTRQYDCAQYSLDAGSDKLDAIDIRVPVGAGVSSKDVKCSFAPRHIVISIGGNAVVEGDLYADISADEATWVVEENMVVVTLVKKTAEYWPEAISGEKQINPFAHRKHVLRVLGDLWKYFQGYDFLAQNADQSIIKRTNWYIQDEVGLSVGHSDTPNVRCLPFLYLNLQGQMTPFSILWPIKSLLKGESLTRDFCPMWLSDKEQRQGYLQAIFPEPTQFALDAYIRLRDSWVQTADRAIRGPLTNLPVPKHKFSRVYVRDASPGVIQALKDAGLESTEAAGDADLVFENVGSSDTVGNSKLSNQHPLNSIFYSYENTIMAFQSVIGMQSWVRPGFHLKTQIPEFIGAALMDGNSWWLLTNDQQIPNVRSEQIITSNWATAVRHVDVGYTSALMCTPSAVASTGQQLHTAERMALLTPDNGLYLWQKPLPVHAHVLAIQDDGKPEPYQVVDAEASLMIPGEQFAKELEARFGSSVFTKFTEEMDHIVADVIRLLLGIDPSDGKSFGLFSFQFAFAKSDGTNGSAITPCLQQIRPVSVTDRLASDMDGIVASAVAVLSGNSGSEAALWKQIKSE
ncbi:hypothetical protein GGI07_000762 [Coemansia sp. Benny D115]|nr:hypothetical protein GGI07_000762 [Coemansia sp. Benny D115]